MDWKLLKNARAATLWAVSSLACSACAVKDSGPAQSTDGVDSATTTAAKTTGASDGTSVSSVSGPDVSSSSASGESAGSSFTGSPGMLCPEPEFEMGAMASVYYDPDAFGVQDLECEATAFSVDGEDQRILDLSCTSTRGGEANPAMIVLNTADVDTELEALVGESGLILSFFNEGLGFDMRPARSAMFTLRDQGGELRIVSYSDAVVQDPQRPVTTVDVSWPWYLADDAKMRAAWNDPLGDIVVRDVGCASRDGTGAAVISEFPWVLELESDEGLEQFYTHSTGSVVVAGIPFFVIVDQALQGTFRPGGDFGEEESELVVGDYLFVRAEGSN